MQFIIRMYTIACLLSLSISLGTGLNLLKSMAATEPVDEVHKGPKKGLSEENVKQIRIEMFIETMADKLRMTPEELMAPEKKTDIPRVPRELIDEASRDNAMEELSDTYHAKEQQVILPGRDLGRTCIDKNTSGCFSFNLTGNIHGDIASAHLWVYKTPDMNDTNVQTFLLYGMKRLRSGKVIARNLIHRHDSYVKEGWVVIDITKTVTSWVQERKSIEMIAIRCATCVTRNHNELFGMEHGYTPLVAIKHDKTSLQYRDRRSDDEDCNPEFECCKRSLHVDLKTYFTNLDEPRNLSIGYCYGNCSLFRNHSYEHTRAKSAFIQSNDITEEMRERLSFCCVPTDLKDTSVQLIGPGSVLSTVILPNTIVDRCGCV